MFPFVDFLTLLTITDSHSNLSQVLYPTNTKYFWFNFILVLTAYNPEN